MIEASNVIDFKEASERLAPVRKRDVALPHSMIRFIAVFLHETNEMVQLGRQYWVSPEDIEMLGSLDIRARLALAHGDKGLKVSRIEIDKIGDWFVNLPPESQNTRNRLSSALLKLDVQFVDQAGGPENPEFRDKIKKAAKK